MTRRQFPCVIQSPWLWVECGQLHQMVLPVSWNSRYERKIKHRWQTEMFLISVSNYSLNFFYNKHIFFCKCAMVKVRHIFFSDGKCRVLMPIKVVGSEPLSFSLIFACRDMCVQDQEDLVLSKAYPKITPAANSCVCVGCVFAPSQRSGRVRRASVSARCRSAAVQHRADGLILKNKKNNVCCWWCCITNTTSNKLNWSHTFYRRVFFHAVITVNCIFLNYNYYLLAELSYVVFVTAQNKYRRISIKLHMSNEKREESAHGLPLTVKTPTHQLLLCS